MRFGPISHLQSSGLSESGVKLVKRELKAWGMNLSEPERKNWHLIIPRINRSINSRCHKDLGTAPSMLFLGWNTLDGPLQRHLPRFDEQLEEPKIVQSETSQLFAEKREISRSQFACRCARKADDAEDKALPVTYAYEKHQIVWEKRHKDAPSTSKFDADWVGSLEVLDVAGTSALCDDYREPTGKPRKIHFSDLKPFIFRRQAIKGPREASSLPCGGVGASLSRVMASALCTVWDAPIYCFSRSGNIVSFET